MRREVELYPQLKKHFLEQGYKVYAEVPALHGGFVDLLAIKGERSIAVEMKLRFSRRVLKQAARNKHFVWQSFVALPETNRRVIDLFKRRPVGLLLVGRGVTVAKTAVEAAPGFTIREVFGGHLAGETAKLYAKASGGLPTAKRVSAYRALAKQVRATILRHGGTASTEQILQETSEWNYYRGKRAGLTALLEARYRSPAPDLWRLDRRKRPAIHAARMDRVAPAQTRSIKVVLDEAIPKVNAGDILWLVDRGAIRARALLKFAERHTVKTTPQRELRAGPAVFSPFRLRGESPDRVIVMGLTGYRELARPKAFRKTLETAWQTLRPSASARK